MPAGEIRLEEMAEDVDEMSDAALTPEERKKLRLILRDQDRMTWLWATARIWAAWIGGTIAAIWAANEWIIWIFKKLTAK